MIAEEVNEVIPELVVRNPQTGEIETISHQYLPFFNWEATRVLQREMSDVKNENYILHKEYDSQRNELDMLYERIARLEKIIARLT
jgi:polyhydroxyalkanoate synthesis regulator phasin